MHLRDFHGFSMIFMCFKKAFKAKGGVYAFEKAKQGQKVNLYIWRGVLCFVKESTSILEVLWSDEGFYASEGVRNA